MNNSVSLIVIDQGNTSTKIAWFQGRTLIDSVRLSDTALSIWKSPVGVSDQTPVFVSSVRSDAQRISSLPFPTGSWSYINSTLKIPLAIGYLTPHTLGGDRLANACAAAYLYPQTSTLVIDMGTCVTYTLIVENTIRGGAISPGLRMRYTALHQHTGKLPLLSPMDGIQPIEIIGLTTADSIRSGVENGLVGEIDAMIQSFCSEINPLNVLITGGDSLYFESKLKSPIFADRHLTLIGLNEIYLYNFSEKVL